MTSTAPVYDPRTPGFVADPYPHYAQLRAENPVHRTRFGFVLLTRHSDLRAAHASPTPPRTPPRPRAAAPTRTPPRCGARARCIALGSASPSSPGTATCERPTTVRRCRATPGC